MKINTENLGELAAELRALPGDTTFAVKAGGKEYSGKAELVVKDGKATLQFRSKK